MTNTGLLSEVVLILSQRGIAAARRRIILSSLYLGTGQHEQDLVHNTHAHTYYTVSVHNSYTSHEAVNYTLHR